MGGRSTANSCGFELESEAISRYGVEGFINDEAEDGSQRRPMFQPLSVQLSDNCIHSCNMKFRQHGHLQTLALICT